MTLGTAVEIIRIRMEAYDHSVLDQSAAEIVDAAKRTGSVAFASFVYRSGCPTRANAGYPLVAIYINQ